LDKLLTWHQVDGHAHLHHEIDKRTRPTQSFMPGKLLVYTKGMNLDRIPLYLKHLNQNRATIYKSSCLQRVQEVAIKTCNNWFFLKNQRQ
jgi:hypothetical protein